MNDWTPEELAGNKAFIEKWKTLGPLLEEERARRIRATDTAQSLGSFDDVLDYALRTREPTQESGLMDLHRWLIPNGDDEQNLR